jgi:uncharacterized protein YjlB
MGDRTQEIKVREHFFEDYGRIPNNPELPLLVYAGVLGESDLYPSRCKELLAENRWGGAWVNGVFSYHHYHSNAPEVLSVMSGEASITLGGPEGTTVEVKAGDVVVIPAGVGHRNAGSNSDFAVLGAYPRGQESYDLRTGEEGERPEVLESIRNVPLPEADPLYGPGGPLPARWSR